MKADAGNFVNDCKKVRERVQAANRVSKHMQIRISAQKKEKCARWSPCFVQNP